MNGHLFYFKFQTSANYYINSSFPFSISRTPFIYILDILLLSTIYFTFSFPKFHQIIFACPFRDADSVQKSSDFFFFAPCWLLTLTKGGLHCSELVASIGPGDNCLSLLSFLTQLSMASGDELGDSSLDAVIDCSPHTTPHHHPSAQELAVPPALVHLTATMEFFCF